MKRSLNEIEHTCRKAARGWGMPWGLADEVGKSVRWLHAFGLDGSSMLVRCCDAMDHGRLATASPESVTGPWKAPGGVLSPLVTGVGLCDCLWKVRGEGIETGPLAWPLLAAGFLGQAVFTQDQAVALAWGDVRIVLWRDGLVVSGDRPGLEVDTCPTLRVESAAGDITGDPLSLHVGDAAVDQQAWTRLEHMAHRTYVPASEASRLAGAGAGLTDND